MNVNVPNVHCAQNSIRHNLSLHSKFMRVQNENTGKSSWWIINPEVREKEKERERERERERQHTSDSRSDMPDAAGSGSSTSNSPKGSLVPNSAAAAGSAFLAARRRATTMDTSEYEMKRNRARKMARAAAAAQMGPLRMTTLAAQQADMAAGAGSTSTIQAGIAGLGFGAPPTANSPGQLATYSELSGSQASLLGYEGGAAAAAAAGTPGERGRFLSARGSGLEVDAATQQYLAQYSAVSPLLIAQQQLFSGVHTPHSEQSASHPLTPQSPLAHGSHQNLQAALMHGSPGPGAPVPVPLPVQLGYRSAYPAQSSASPTRFSDTDLEPSAYAMGTQLRSAASASYYEQLADSSTGGFAAYPVVSASSNYPLPIAEEPLQYQASFAVDMGAGNAADFLGKLGAAQAALNPYSATSAQPSLLAHQTRGHQHHQHQSRATVAAPVSSAAAPLLTSLLSPGPLIAGGRHEAARTSGGNSLCAPMTLETKPSASQLFSEHNRSHPNLYQSPPEQQQQPAPQLTTQSSIPPELEAQRMRSQFAYETKPTADELAAFQQQRRLAAMQQQQQQQQASSPSNYLPAVNNSMGLNKSASTGDTKGLYPPAYGAAMQQLHSSPYPNGGGGGVGVGVHGMPGGEAELDVGEERKSSVASSTSTGVFELSSLDAVDYVDPMRMFDAQQTRFDQHQPHRI